MKNKVITILALSFVLMAGSAKAVPIGGFDVTAFASVDLSESSGSFFFANEDNFIDAASDMSVESYVAGDGNAILGLSFAAGELVDGAGADLVLFEIGTIEAFNITIDGTDFGPFTPTYSGQDISLLPPNFANDSLESRGLNFVAIDLGLLGISSATSVVLGLSDGGADFALAGAVAPVPVPAAVWLFGSGLIGLVGIARRR